MLNILHQQFPLLFEKYAGFYHQTELPARAVLLHEGDVSKKAYLIEKGCIRAWFNSKGKDVTFQFFFENEAVSSIESFKRNTASLYSLETVEPTILYWISKADWQTVQAEMNADAETREQLLNITLDRQLNYMNHFMSFIKYSPKERYLQLLKEKPHIIRRVPQHYIASYLGITPVSLSRIRNAISR